MARKKKTGKQPGRRRLVLRTLPLAAACLLATATVLGARSAWREIQDRPEFRVDPLALAVNDGPPWVNTSRMSQELRSQLRRVPSDLSIFDRELAAVVKECLAHSPWVREVSRVKRRLPNMLAVEAVFRQPAGLVLAGGKQYMVDAEGHWLRGDLFAKPPEWKDTPPPLIVDAALRGAPPIGRRWDGPRLAVGARLSRYLLREGLLGSLPLASIDVTGVARPAEPDIVLNTAEGVQIKWGKSSLYGPVEGLEPPVFGKGDEEKLSLLQSKLVDYPRLEGIRHIDLRFHGQIVFASAE